MVSRVSKRSDLKLAIKTLTSSPIIPYLLMHRIGNKLVPCLLLESITGTSDRESPLINAHFNLRPSLDLVSSLSAV